MNGRRENSLKSVVQTKVRDYIKSHGIKQKFIADAIGLDQKTTSAIFTGRRELRADELMDICIAINVSPDYFCKTE